MPSRKRAIGCNPDANLEPTSFSVTSDGRWAAWSLTIPYGTRNGSHATGGEIVSLKDGAVRADRELYGVLGPYIVDSHAFRSASKVKVADPANGSALGSFAVGRARRFVEAAPEQMEPLASSGFFPDQTAALSADGRRLMMVEVEPSGAGRIAAYSLPEMSAAWRWRMPSARARAAAPELVADDGGVLLVYAEEPNAGKALVAIDDRSGKVLWSLPNLSDEGKGSGPVCGVSSRELLATIGADVSTLDIHTGKQIFLDTNAVDCSSVLPGGIEVEESENSTTVTQRLVP